MKLLFKQRFFSWLDSYDIFDENGDTVYTVEGELAWGHLLRIYDAAGNELGSIREKIFTWIPKFEIYLGDQCVGMISKRFTFFNPMFDIDFNGWHVEGDWLEWDYNIMDGSGRCIATITKEIFNWTDTYSIEIAAPHDALCVLMLVLAIDAEKCSRDD